MQSGRARALAIALAIAGTGCAELAPSVPALTIECVALERRDVTAGTGSRWSWGVGAALATRIGTPGIDAADGEPEPELGPRADARRPRSRMPCRVPDLCVWEARARTRALSRLRRGEGGR